MPDAPQPRFRQGLYPMDGFNVTLPGGIRVDGDSLDDLFAKVAKAAGMSLEQATAYTHAKLCARYPSSCENGRASYGDGLSVGDRAVLHLTRLMDNKGLYTPETRPAADEVAIRRESCRFCPHNLGKVMPGCCSTPATVSKLAVEAGKQLGAEAPLEDGWCGALGFCISLDAQVLAPEARGMDGIYPTDTVYDALPTFCPYKR